MKLLEQIIRKALLRSNRYLVEQSSKWTLDRLKNSVIRNVNQLGTDAVTGFTVNLQGDELNIKNSGSSIASWLTKLANLKPTSEFETPGENSKIPDLNQYSNGNYVLVYGKDNVESKSEKRAGKQQSPSGGYNDSYNVIVFPIDNLRSILTDENIDKIAINAWKYPAAKGTEFAEPGMPGQILYTDISTNADSFGNSPLLFSGNLASQRKAYQTLLPIAREMRNTPQPGAAATRNKDIETAIALMESFINDFPDWERLTNAISPKSKKRDSVLLAGTGQDTAKRMEYEKWDATDSSQSVAIQNQMLQQQSSQSDAEAIASGTTAVEVENKEYETKWSPTGIITFTGKWNLKTQTPIDGVATNSVGDEWDGQWDENGKFFSGQGYIKYQDGREWRGSFNRGVPAGPGKFISPTITFEGTVKTVNGEIIPLKGYQIQTIESAVPGKKDSIEGTIENSKLTKGTWIRYALESGKTAEYKFTGTFTLDGNETPLNGDVQKDGKPFGKFENGVFIKL